MSYLDPPGHRDPYGRRHGSRSDGAPEGYRYGDGLSAVPLYAEPGAAPDPDAVDQAPFFPEGGDPIGDDRYGEGWPDGDRSGGDLGVEDLGAGNPVAGNPVAGDFGAGNSGAEDLDAGDPRGGDPIELALRAGRTGRSRHQRRAESTSRRSRAGRNLPAAIGVGVLLGGIVLASLVVWRPAFVIVVALAAGVGVWETVGAIRREAPGTPLVPLLAGTAVIVTSAWTGGAEAAMLGLALTVLAALIWRLADGPVGYHRDVTATALVSVYVPFLASFAVMLAEPDDGDLRVVVTLAAVVLSDTGGYVAGVFFGRHPMAPTVSPKKSWEGLAGSLLATAAGSALLLFLLLDRPWWQGAVFGLALSVAAVLGDLAESLLKRDLGVKDMSSLLPGHGGLMDRLDSILFAAPTAFVLLSVLSP